MGLLVQESIVLSSCSSLYSY
uniref:Uncharacterized protein n=1 Tax=Arundo donax TaxID=35708 RepID=A0A0A9FQV3_ARUDO